jgi:hypothetical protein
MIRRSNSHSLQILQQFFLLQETDLPCFTVNGQKMLNFDRDAGAVGLDSRGGLMGRICIARGAYFPAIILIYIYWLYGVKNLRDIKLSDPTRREERHTSCSDLRKTRHLFLPFLRGITLVPFYKYKIEEASEKVKNHPRFF